MRNTLPNFAEKILLIIGLVVIYTGCRLDDEVITETNFDSLEFADFVEKDFPFINTSLDLRDIGSAFPTHNFSSRALAVQLGNNAYMAFDTDLLRWSVAWTGDFVSMKGVAQVSYKDFFNKNDGFPEILGEAVMATGIYPGWSVEKPLFEDVRETVTSADSLVWGPLPREYGRWKGTYTYGDKVVLNYSIGEEGTDIYDMPAAYTTRAGILFTRTIRAKYFNQKMYTVIGEFENIVHSEYANEMLSIYTTEDREEMILIGIKGSKEIKDRLSIIDGRYVVLELSPENHETTRLVYFWSGSPKEQDIAIAQTELLTIELPVFEKGGKAYWTDQVYTKGKLAPDTSAFVLDELTLPLPNPWKRNVRVADVDFFKDGRAAVLTFSGDVWILQNINAKLSKLQWKRFASGFFEPMSIGIYDEKIFVFGREGVTRLHDLNKDGNADFYENYVVDIVQSIDSREWAGDMAFDDQGYIYIAKGGGTIPSSFPSIAEQAPRGFRASSVQAGTVLKISPDGEHTKVFSTGLRVPYIGLNPSTGFLTVSDQQGNFVPATPIYYAVEGDYFGVVPAAHTNVTPITKNPLVWIPHRIDQSSISQLWLNGGKMGPLNNSLVHFSFGRPGVFTVLIDSVTGEKQAGVVYIKANYPAPVLKGAMGTKDGQLYVAGFNLWGSNSQGISALTRLRYTGKPYYLPIGFRAGKQGVLLSFSEKLDENSVKNLQNFKVKRWNYERTSKYGSGHFLLNGEPGEESLPVLESYLSKDKKSILLVLPNMTEVMQMELNYSIKTQRGYAIENEFYFTVNDASEMDIGDNFESVQINLTKLTLDEKELEKLQVKGEEVSVKLGAELFDKYACSGCHSLDKTVQGKYGPSLEGIYNSIRTFKDGTTAVANEEYLRESVLYSKNKILEGYGDEMPSYLGVLGDNEVESLVLFMKSQ